MPPVLAFITQVHHRDIVYNNATYLTPHYPAYTNASAAASYFVYDINYQIFACARSRNPLGICSISWNGNLMLNSVCLIIRTFEEKRTCKMGQKTSGTVEVGMKVFEKFKEADKNSRLSESEK